LQDLVLRFNRAEASKNREPAASGMEMQRFFCSFHPLDNQAARLMTDFLSGNHPRIRAIIQRAVQRANKKREEREEMGREEKGRKFLFRGETATGN